MRYKYASYLNDLKDLKHIEWFINHRDQYQFTETAEKIADRLEQFLHNKNIYYSEILKGYEFLVSQFNNDPYEFCFDTKGERSSKQMESFNSLCYFMRLYDEKERRYYMVPYQYAFETFGNKLENYQAKAKKMHEDRLEYQKSALENMDAVKKHYYDYWEEGGVKTALENYRSVDYGKSYDLTKNILLYFIYNFILFSIINNPISGAPLWITLLSFAVCIYFIYLDVQYTYGLYYLIYIKEKYKDLMKYQKKISDLFKDFYEDYKVCTEGFSNSMLQKKYHRVVVYEKLIELSNRRYVLWDTHAKGEEKVPESVTVPKGCFYSKPLGKKLKWLAAIWIIMILAGYIG